ncbi:hypothetical protein [Owenweeksia hongkongensis]|uniref:hypothetical protein n=1 Tax=Owenweeksia hongkongensis TaxID=253245 RepID=UPI003A90F613
MRQNLTPYWDDLIFSINIEQLSTKHRCEPWFKYLKVHICEHSTGNRTIIPKYPCRPGHSPSIEELLTYLLHKSKLYVEALDSTMEPHLFMMQHFKWKDSSQGLTAFLQAQDCFNSLCVLLKGTGVDVETLAIILNKQL